MILTEKLGDYWRDRSSRFEKEYSPILNNLKSLTNQDQWSTVEDILEQIARENNRNSREIQATHPYSNQQQPGQKKYKNCRYKKPNFPITNLSDHQLSRDEINLLSKGFNFIPTRRRDHPAKMLQDILLFDRRIRLRYHFTDAADQTQVPQKQTNSQILQPSSGWTPLVDKTPS